MRRRNSILFAGGLGTLLVSFAVVFVMTSALARFAGIGAGMNLIEQAAKRLEELKRAGAEIDESAVAGRYTPSSARRRQDLPTPEAAMRANSARAKRSLPRLRPFRRTRLPHRLRRSRSQTSSETRRCSSTRRRGARCQPQLELNLERLKNQGMVTPDALRTRSRTSSA
jgi:hypothetical protein